MTARPGCGTLPIRPTRTCWGLSLTSSAATVQSVAYSPGGHTLASGDYIGTVRLWDVTNPAQPQPLSSISASGAAVGSVAFSPDGHTLASGRLDGTIQLWNIADPAQPTLLGQAADRRRGRRPVRGVQSRRPHAGQR